ncbi:MULTISPECIES: hypothetical protein [unclassified Ruegeria]|uniref:hypothetical protein n=1 Tax=unclassified Ruegeria TaxID=2625375 RepID=UPI0014895D5D|nr:MULTISPECIES: hypothetical protein [unclassified Ruegeria]
MPDRPRKATVLFLGGENSPTGPVKYDDLGLIPAFKALKRPQSGAAFARLRCFGLAHVVTPGFLRPRRGGTNRTKEHSI